MSFTATVLDLADQSRWGLSFSSTRDLVQKAVNCNVLPASALEQSATIAICAYDLIHVGQPPIHVRDLGWLNGRTGCGLVLCMDPPISNRSLTDLSEAVGHTVKSVLNDGKCKLEQRSLSQSVGAISFNTVLLIVCNELPDPQRFRSNGVPWPSSVLNINGDMETEALAKWIETNALSAWGPGLIDISGASPVYEHDLMASWFLPERFAPKNDLSILSRLIFLQSHDMNVAPNAAHLISSPIWWLPIVRRFAHAAGLEFWHVARQVWHLHCTYWMARLGRTSNFKTMA